MSARWRPRALVEVRAEHCAEQRLWTASTRREFTRAGVPPHISLSAPQQTGWVEALQYEDEFRDKVEKGDLYWVEQPMAELALDASSDMPDFPVDEHLPSPQGLIAFAGGLPPLVFDHAHAGIVAANIRFVTWALLDQPSFTVAPELEIRAWAEHDDMPASWRAAVEGGQNIPTRWAQVAKVVTNPGSRVESILERYPEGSTGERGLLYLLGATFHLMQMPTLVEVANLPPSLGKRGRQQMASGRPDVRLVNLRQLREVSTTADLVDANGKAYTHRWIVRGHWRNQAHGPGRSERRNIYIEPHIKGPDGAPLLRNQDVVRVWRR